jgi:ABC-2 type transport system ATP-binding protein
VREVRELIRSLGSDRTVLLSTHILSEVSQLCSRILIINRGQIVAEDNPESLAGRLEGAMRFFVRVGNAPSDEVAAVLGELDDVADVYATEQGVEVTASRENDARPAVASTVVNHAWDLLELRSLQMSLEDIFLELTTDEEMFEKAAVEEEGEAA